MKTFLIKNRTFHNKKNGRIDLKCEAKVIKRLVKITEKYKNNLQDY